MSERKKGLYPYQMGAANFMAKMRSAEQMRRASIERAKAEVINYWGLYGVRRLPKGFGKTGEKK